MKKKQGREEQIREELRRKQLADAQAQASRRKKHVLATYGPGDTFGELALLYPCKREASVLVTSPKVGGCVYRGLLLHVLACVVGGGS